MITPKQVHHAINISTHVLILFTFLTIFFFTFISVKEKDLVDGELKNAIADNIPKLLDKIQDINKSNTLDWNKIKQFAVNIQKKYNNKPDPDIKKSNDKLFNISIGIAVGLFVFIISAVCYFTLYKKYDIGLKSILIDNIIIAILIGGVEAFFFVSVAFKYIPTTSSDMFTQIIDRVTYNINKQME